MNRTDYTGWYISAPRTPPSRVPLTTVQWLCGRKCGKAGEQEAEIMHGHGHGSISSGDGLEGGKRRRRTRCCLRAAEEDLLKDGKYQLRTSSAGMIMIIDEQNRFYRLVYQGSTHPCFSGASHHCSAGMREEMRKSGDRKLGWDYVWSWEHFRRN